MLSSSFRWRTSVDFAMYRRKENHATPSGTVKTNTPKSPIAWYARARAAPCTAVAPKFTGIQL